MSNTHWYNKPVVEILEAFSTTDHGLTQKEAQHRLKEHGSNVLPEVKGDSFLVIFIRQFASPLIYVLLAAAVVVYVLGEVVDALVIIFVLLFNAIVGAVQEGRAQKTLASLKRFVQTSAVVLRDKTEIILPDNEVVPGDILLLQAGDKVAADARVILSNSLTLDEAALTGESEPVHKIVEPFSGNNLALSDQRNMVFKGTHVVAGSAHALVVATGISTFIGAISKQIAVIDTEIPLKTDVRRLSRFIILAVGVISLFLLFSGAFLGKPLSEMFRTVVALSVSVIPEGLPIVLTLVLATGVWRMSKRNALIKRLQAVEALGQAQVIAVDKTGTITKNELMVQTLYVDGKQFEITGSGYEPRGEVLLNNKAVAPVNHQELLLVGKISALCSNARAIFSEGAKTYQVSGDPTEAAMSVFANKIGFDKAILETEGELVAEVPFDYKTKYHATLYKFGGQKILSVVGAPETILSLCRNVWQQGKELPMSQQKRQELEKIFQQISQNGLRVVGLSISNEAPLTFEPGQIKNLTFVGFLGMADALRAEVPSAMARAYSAGIRVVMITGDHVLTAKAIAKQAGIWQQGQGALTGEEIDNLSSERLAKLVGQTSVFARVTPEHKLKIINAFRARGEIVAMTGDGVNDAPSLVAADLGVAMGRIGTEVAKEAADIVLLDDNFGSIVSAVEEGRSIYKTIKKVILYLFSTSVGEALTITGALFVGYPLPLLPAQIIWLNLVTDGFLDVALAMEPKEQGLLTNKFEKSGRYLVDKLMLRRILVMSLPMMIGALWLFSRYFETDLAKAWTISLTTLAVFQWFNAWNCRSEQESVFKMNPFSNPYLVAATIIIVLLQLLAIYNPFFQQILRTVPLTFGDWLLIVPVASTIVVVEEIRKFFYRRKSYVR